MSEEYERFKRWWESDVHSHVINKTDNKKICGKEIENIFMDEANQLNDTVNEIANKIQEQQRLFQTTTIIKDIIKAYKGQITWDEYLKEKRSIISQIREQNKISVLNPKENYTLKYQVEPPIIDRDTFMIAERLGKLDRGEE